MNDVHNKNHELTEEESKRIEILRVLNEVIEDVITMPRLTYEEITMEKAFDYTQKAVMETVEENLDEFTYKFVRVDEREEEPYCNAVFEKDIEQDMFPYRGYFHYVHFRTKEQMYGIVEHIHRYDHVDLKNDERFFNHEKQWEVKDVRIFDETEKKYIEVPYRNEKHETTRMYQDRLEQVNQTLTKLEEIAKEVHQKFIKFYKLRTPNMSAQSMKIYFSKCRTYLEKELLIFLKLHLAYGNINIFEYLAVIDKAEQIKVYCKQASKILSKYDDNETMNDFGVYDEQKKKDYAMLNAPSHGRSLIESVELFKTMRKPGRKIEEKANEWHYGYVGYNLERMTMFPNPAEIERRRSKKKEAMTKEDYEFITRRYLRYLKDSGKQSSQSVQREFELTKEEIEEINDVPNHFKNREIFAKCKLKGWDLDKTIRELAKFEK